MVISKSATNTIRRFAILAIGTLIVGTTACSAVWVQNKDAAKDNTIYMYAQSEKEVKDTDAYKALKRDEILVAITALEASLKSDPNAHEDRRRLAILYEMCDEREMAISLLKTGIEAATAKNDSVGKSSFEHHIEAIEKRAKKH